MTGNLTKQPVPNQGEIKKQPPYPNGYPRNDKQPNKEGESDSGVELAFG